MKKILTLLFFAVLLIAPAYAEEWVSLDDGLYIDKDSIEFNYKNKEVYLWMKKLYKAPYDEVQGVKIGESRIKHTLSCKNSVVYANEIYFYDLNDRYIDAYYGPIKNTILEGSLFYKLCQMASQKHKKEK